MSEFLLLALLIVAALWPVFWSARLAVDYWLHSGPTPPPDADAPKAAVILSLRGSDPSLVHCLRGLLRQDYPHFFLHIVVDSEEDPAWKTVQDFLAQEGVSPEKISVRVSVLKQWGESCSLKISSQLQALAELDDSVEVVAFIDADSITAPDWLAAMVKPLEDRRVGATTGIRWFAPNDLSWGNLVRHVYNSASFTQMHAFSIPWGGSLALRRETLDRSGLIQHWSNCFCEDTATYGALRRLGLRIVFVPAASQFNREAVELEGARKFILRQLLCVRLHHVHWPTLFFFNMANTLALTIAPLLLLAGFIFDRPAWIIVSALVLPAYVIGQLGTMITGEWLIRRNMRGRVADIPRYPLDWKFIPAALLAQSLSIQSMIATLTLRQIDWRGIAYAIDGRDQIRLLEYHPFTSSSQHLDPSRSVV